MGKRKNDSDAVRLADAGGSPAPAGRWWQREFCYEGWRAFRESVRAARVANISRARNAAGHIGDIAA
jgi:hypothetical protein